MNKVPKELFFVWLDGDGYFNQYESIEDAVGDNDSDGTTVYQAVIKPLGKFKLGGVVKVVEPKRKSSRRKAK